MSRIRQIKNDIWEAISGTTQDFTKGSIRRAVFLLSVPMVLEMIMESIFAVVDIYFVSRLGAEAVATVGLTESIVTIVYSLAVGLSMATTALVARRIGEKKPKEASRTAFQAILTGIVISLFIAIPGILFSKDILGLMGANETMQNEYSGYTKIMLGANGVIMLLFVINAIFRSSGDAAISMRVLWIANIINIILDPLLIFGIGPFPELGVAGAAIATTTGRGIAVIYQFYLLMNGKQRIRIRISDIIVRFSIIKQIIKLSLGGIGQNLIATASWIGLMRIVSTFGSDAVAGYTIGIRVILFSLLPSWGISNAAATLVGQNLGAKQPDRAEKSVWITGVINAVFLGSMGIFFILFPSFFIQLFIQDPAVVKSGVACLQIISFGFIMYGFGMVMIQSFNGAGDTLTPTIINFLSFWLIEIPLAWILADTFGMKQDGVYWAIVVAETFMTFLALWLFRKGKWKENKV
ncbi:MAG: MATE family efflux transporter [Bacteroidales bacterium]|nr:MATE family efflux transporter [Bacteroidales bacterium]